MSPDDSADGIINELASAGGTVRDTENTTTPSRDACPSIPTTAAPVTTTTDAVDAILSRHVEQHVYDSIMARSAGRILQAAYTSAPPLFTLGSNSNAGEDLLADVHLDVESIQALYSALHRELTEATSQASCSETLKKVFTGFCFELQNEWSRQTASTQPTPLLAERPLPAHATGNEAKAAEALHLLLSLSKYGTVPEGRGDVVLDATAMAEVDSSLKVWRDLAQAVHGTERAESQFWVESVQRGKELLEAWRKEHEKY